MGIGLINIWEELSHLQVSAPTGMRYCLQVSKGELHGSAGTSMPLLSGDANRSARIAAAVSAPGACTIKEFTACSEPLKTGCTTERCLQHDTVKFTQTLSTALMQDCHAVLFAFRGGLPTRGMISGAPLQSAHA